MHIWIILAILSVPFVVMIILKILKRLNVINDPKRTDSQSGSLIVKKNVAVMDPKKLQRKIKKQKKRIAWAIRRVATQGTDYYFDHPWEGNSRCKKTTIKAALGILEKACQSEIPEVRDYAIEKIEAIDVYSAGFKLWDKLVAIIKSARKSVL